MTVFDVLDATAASISHITGIIPDPDPQQPPGTEGVTTAMAWLKWLGYAIVGGAIIVGGIMISVSLSRGEGRDAAPKILFPVAGAIVIGAGAAIVGALAGA